MAIWLQKSRSALTRPGLPDILNRRIFCGSLYHCNPYITSTFSRNEYPLHSSFLGHSLRFRASQHSKALQQEDQDYSVNDQDWDFPGGQVPFTTDMKFIAGSSKDRIHCYRILDNSDHQILSSNSELISKELAVKLYSNMVTLQMLDTIFNEAQRQGRISFYLTSNGEEAINIASAAALSNDDVILPQYREHGVLLWRGFSLQEFANQCFGNRADYGKGRQMPVHYGSNKLNYITVSSPLATQIPQAVGVAYSLKMEKKDACAVTYFGDGSTSEGDFHAGLNFAAVLEAPVIFFCRNNGWAISTPTTDQFRSDGIVAKGQAYGIPSIRVDGNDVLAVYDAVREAREMAVREQRPVLIEALTYRVGHHSTSDDSTKYRAIKEIQHWKTARNPISRYRNWVERNGWWNEEQESELRRSVREQLMNAIQVAEQLDKPLLTDLFTDVYHDMPSNLKEQERSLGETIHKHPQDYPSGFAV
ncbi:2-oxoisovalerate dehydrogenase subunit alpha 1, mitochondrial-like [Apium graveolens]|uniref:2-oxoisovalerate dehydrogenase subunit alpha 1, mitochondrial-like n=1 Tax=Apium graveolens TaxID=4045 RepID=UPI003D7B003B